MFAHVVLWDTFALDEAGCCGVVLEAALHSYEDGGCVELEVGSSLENLVAVRGSPLEDRRALEAWGRRELGREALRRRG
jgi:hypothetical protein